RKITTPSRRSSAIHLSPTSVGPYSKYYKRAQLHSIPKMSPISQDSTRPTSAKCFPACSTPEKSPPPPVASIPPSSIPTSPPISMKTRMSQQRHMSQMSQTSSLRKMKTALSQQRHMSPHEMRNEHEQA